MSFNKVKIYAPVLSLIISLGIYFLVIRAFSSQLLQIIRLQQFYALTALTFLFLSMMTEPIYSAFKTLPFRKQSFELRSSLIVSTFYFGLIHGLISFYGQLGGWGGLGFLSSTYLTAITLSFTALTLLMILSTTFSGFATQKFPVLKSKAVMFLLYFAGVLVLLHALMLGTHFRDLSATIPQILFIGIALFFALETLRLDSFLQNKFSFMPRLGIAFVVFLGIITAYFYAKLVPVDSPLSLGIHSQHIELAKQSQQNAVPSYLKNLPGMTGDRTKRFSIDWNFEDVITPGRETLVKFRVFDASNGQPINLFTINYEKIMHLIVVDSGLKTYQHIHPELKDGWFEIPITFADSGRYHLYIDFVPNGAIEQQVGVSIKVGDGQITEASREVEGSMKKAFGDYQIELSFDKPLEASRMSVGEAKLDFRIMDKNGNSVSTLKPYLGSFGHLVMINTQTYEYIHVHPVQTGNLKPDQNGGPLVEFMPVGIYGPIKPGIYKLFGQFNPNGNLVTSDFTVEVK